MVCEQAALDAGPQIGNSGGATFSTRVSTFALADTNGFAGQYSGASASLYVEVMAQEEDGRLRNAGWFTAARQLHRLEDEQAVGREAAARALRQLGAEKGETHEAPVVWEPRMAAGLASIVAQAASGEALYRGSTFLAGQEGEAVASALLSISDDATLPGQLGSRPFDGEGVGSRVNPLLEAGVFRGFLFDCYNARRVGAVTTGSADRGVGGLALDRLRQPHHRRRRHVGRGDHRRCRGRSLSHHPDGLRDQLHDRRLLKRRRRHPPSATASWPSL